MQLFYFFALIIFLFDQITKYLILRWNYTFLEITPFLNLVKIWNKGMAFGLMEESFKIFSILILFLIPLILFLVYLYAKKTDKINKILLGIIFGGGLGNWLDRIRYGAVLDFIDLHYQNYHWPAFNIADVAITVGLILFILRNAFKN
ncbi:MAG: signal peptidase II [Caldimicrobium sp.]